MLANSEAVRNLSDQVTPLGELLDRIPLELIVAHHSLLASKLGKKASTIYGPIHGAV